MVRVQGLQKHPPPTPWSWGSGRKGTGVRGQPFVSTSGVGGGSCHLEQKGRNGANPLAPSAVKRYMDVGVCVSGRGGAASKLSPESELLGLGEEGVMESAGWLAGRLLLTSAGKPAHSPLSRPSSWILTPGDCSPCPSLPWPLSQVPTLCVSLPQALLAHLKPCLSPELGNCEPHASGVHRTSASAVPLLGTLALGAWASSPRALQSP